MAADLAQFTFYFIIVSAALRLLQAWFADRNPDSEWFKALAFIA